MELVSEMIRNVAAYLVLVTIILNLVSGTTYKKYAELVCGMILILIVLGPIGKLLSLDETVLYQFKLSNFEMEMREEGIFDEAESIKQERIKEAYTKVLNERIERIVEQEGRQVKKTKILLDEEEYGVIEEMEVAVSSEEGEKVEENRTLETENGIEKVEQIEQVEIQLSGREEIKEPVLEKNKVTESIRKQLASEFAMKEERIVVYQEE